MKKILLAVMLFAALDFQGQVVKINLQASGLTCSMCSNAINKALRSLDFVNKVEANIKNSSFEIQFKQDAAVDFDKVKKKVEDAGYAVANFWLTLNFSKVDIENAQYAVIGNYSFHFINVAKQTLNGEKTVRLIDKGFVSAKEFKKNSVSIKIPCYAGRDEGGKKAYHVTL